MAYSDYKFTPEDKMMLTMVKMICENTLPEKRCLPIMKETEKECLLTNGSTEPPIKSKSKNTTSTISKPSPNGCGSQSPVSPKHRNPKNRKLQSSTILVR